MTNLRRRLKKLESQLTDRCGLVPHSQKWLHHWEQRIYRMFTGEEPGTPGCIPLEAYDAVREAWEAEGERAGETGGFGAVVPFQCQRKDSTCQLPK